MKTFPLSVLFRFSHVVFMLSLLVLNACQKSHDGKAPDTIAEDAPREAPTGLVKNPVRQSSDVTKWMDIASNKSPAQIAREEREKDAKADLDAKTLAAKAAGATAAAAQVAATSITAKPTTQPTATQIATSARPADAPASAIPPVVAPIKPAVTELAPKSSVPVALSATPVAAEQNILKVINSVQPKFPVAVAREGITEGLVSARLHVEPDGKVSRVEIIKAKPSRHFDKEVIAAASQWKYAPMSHSQVAVVEFNFKLDN